MSSRIFVTWMSALCAGCALAIGLFDARGMASSAVDPPVPAIPSAEPASPTVTPLPTPPPVPPPDAAGISATTPPIDAGSPQPIPTVPNTLWLTAGSDTSTVPIALHGGRPFVPVVVDGVRRDFLLSSMHASAIDGTLPVDGGPGSFFLRTLQIGDVRLTNVKVSRERFVPFSQTYLGAPAAGILGAEFFERYPVTIDYPNRTMTIYRSTTVAEMGRPSGATVTPLEIVGGSPAVSCTIDGAKAAPCFLDVYSDVDLSLWGSGWTYKNEAAMLMRDAEPGGEMRGVVVRAHQLTIGSVAVAGPIVEFIGQDNGAPVARRAVLGSGAFSRSSVTIDEPGGALIVSGDPSAALTPSPCDGSGLWLVWRNGTVLVRSVMHKSPADAAGIINGDVILAIDGRPIGDVDTARAALMRATGTKTTVTYQRGAVQRDVVLTLRSLI